MIPRRHRLLATAALVALVALVALPGLVVRPAAAVVLYEDAFAGDEVTLGATVKTLTCVLHGGVLDLMPTAGSDPLGLSHTTLRPRFEAQVGEWLRVVLHYEVGLSVASAAGTGGWGGPFVAGAAQPPPRFLPLHGTPIDDDHLTVAHALDWAFLRLRFGVFDVTVGRQPVTFGRALLWSPLDLVAPFAPTALDRQFKPGADALRIDVALGARSTLALVAVAGELEGDHDAAATLAGSSFAARATVGFARFDLGGFAGYVRKDALIGVDAFADLDVVTLHGELTVTWSPEPAPRSPEPDVFARATFGVTWRIPRFTLVAEAHYSGAGGADPVDYLARTFSPRVQVGEVFTLGRYYLGVVADWEAHPLVHVTLTAMGNLRDPSVLLAPALVYSAAQNLEVVLGAMVPLGKTTPLTAGNTVGLVIPESEFGLYPVFYHLSLRLSL